MLSKSQARSLARTRKAKYTQRPRLQGVEVSDGLEVVVLPSPEVSMPSLYYDYNFPWQTLGYYRPGLRTIRYNSLHRRQEQLFIEDRLYQLTLYRQTQPPITFGIPRGFEVLMDTEHLIVQRTRESGIVHRTWFNQGWRPANYELLTSKGKRILFCVDFQNPIRRSINLWRGQSFQLNIVQLDGHQIFKIYGKPNCLGFGDPEVLLYHQEQVLGRLVRRGRYYTTEYCIYNQDDRLMYIGVPVNGYEKRDKDEWWRFLFFKRHIYQLPRIPMELDIVSTDRTVHLGRVTTEWKNYYDSFGSNFELTADTSVHRLLNGGYPDNEIGWILKGEHFGVSFPADVGPVNRALFLALVFMHFHAVHDSMSRRTHAHLINRVYVRPLKCLLVISPFVYLFFWIFVVKGSNEQARLKKEADYNQSTKLLNLTF